jgi:hypothetical protein
MMSSTGIVVANGGDLVKISKQQIEAVIDKLVEQQPELSDQLEESTIQDLVDAFGPEGNPKGNAVGPYSRESETSRLAALRVYPKSGSQRWKVLIAIARAGERGMTRDELGEYLRLPDSSVDGRVWELKQGNWIDESDQKRKTRYGSLAAALVLVPGAEKKIAQAEGIQQID